MSGTLSYLAAQERIHDLRREQDQRRATGMGRAPRRHSHVEGSVGVSIRLTHLRRRLRLA
jgi:hypothetical protein